MKPACEYFENRLANESADSLSADSKIREHLASCEQCSALAHAFHELDNHLQKDSVVDAREHVVQQLLAQVRRESVVRVRPRSLFAPRYVVSAALLICGAALLVVGLHPSFVARNIPKDWLLILDLALFYLEGSFGALLLVSAMLVAIVATVRRHYRTAGGFVSAAICLFVFRSYQTVYFYHTDASLDETISRTYSHNEPQVFYNDTRISLPEGPLSRLSKEQAAAPVESIAKQDSSATQAGPRADDSRQRTAEIEKSIVTRLTQRGLAGAQGATSLADADQLLVGGSAAPYPDSRAPHYNSEAHGFVLPPSPYSGNSGANYIPPPSIPVIQTSQEAISTFSVDVDTASYTNARRFIQNWQLPPPEAIRTEEFINYFSYDYPKQYEKPFSVHSEVAPSPFTPGAYLMKIGIRAKDIKESDKPWNLVFLVDVSGSMSPPQRLPLIKQALLRLSQRTRSQDRISIVTYAGNAGVALPPTAGDNRERIRTAIEQLGAGGSTNGAQGINTAYDLAAQSFIKGGVNRVILATDGDFNVGVTSHNELIQMIEKQRQRGISLTAIGVGDNNLNDGTLEQLADKGNGNYFYLDSTREAERVFEDRLAGTIETVAKDVKIQVEFNPSQVVQYKLIGYENRALAKEDFKDDRVDAGEIGAGHTVTALYEIVLAHTPAADRLVTEYRYKASSAASSSVSADAKDLEQELGFVKMRFKEPDGDTSTESSFPVFAKDVVSALSFASTDLRFAAAVAGFAEILRHSPIGNATSFATVEGLAQGALGEDAQRERQDFLELVRQAATIRDQGR